MQLPQAKLEQWMREHYFNASYDLGSSGVYSYSLKDINEILGYSPIDETNIIFDDSYTVGVKSLREAIATQWGNGDPGNVMVANGSNEMLYHITSTLLEPEDEVILLDPIYHALSTVAETKNCNIKYWNLLPENGYRPDFDELEKLVSKNTRLIAVNFPHNPTGITINRDELNRLIDICSSVDAYLLWDAAFEQMGHESILPNPYYLYKKSISVGTLSKGYGLPGLRVGWCFAPDEVIQKAVQLRDYTTLYVSPLVETVATPVIQQSEKFLKPRMEEAHVNLATLKSWITLNESHVRWSNPKGGVTCLLSSQKISNYETFCQKLSREYSVMMVPSSVFGLDGAIRLGFGCSQSDFEQGLSILDNVLNEM